MGKPMGGQSPLYPSILIVAAAALAYRYSWARSWLISGASALSYLSVTTNTKEIRPSPGLPVPILLTLINLACAAASTSWLFYWLFASASWTASLVIALSRYNALGDFSRRKLRALLRQLQFTADKVAFFDLPAMEIDVDVAGLMVIRGITLSLSSLTLEAAGIEVGIKLSDDMELAIQTDKVTVAFFRSITVSDVYANIKGGAYEMTFGQLEENSSDPQGNALMDSDTPLLRAVTSRSSQDTERWHDVDKVKMTDKMTDGNAPSEMKSAQEAAESMTTFAADDDQAAKHYKETMEKISATSEIHLARRRVKRLVREKMASGSTEVDLDNEFHVRAAVCSQLHDKPSIQHAPNRSIKVSTLKNLSSPSTRKFLHRLPMLLRLLLNPIAYFHPIFISSITATASGRWVQSLLGSKVFQDYADSSSDIRKLRERVFAWLSDANFAFQMAGVVGTAQVPFIPEYDIQCRLLLEDIVAYRTLPREIDLREVLQLSGADATFMIPSFLLPHHEHLLPSRKERHAEAEKQRMTLKKADSMSKVVQAKHFIEQDEKDETNCKISAHIRLPARFDQELLNFVATLVKATKIIEFEKDDQNGDTEIHGFKEFSRVLSNNMKEGLKRATVNAAANDKWIAKLVGKVTKKLQIMQGDVGYSGNIPVALKPYRDAAESATKILP